MNIEKIIRAAFWISIGAMAIGLGMSLIPPLIIPGIALFLGGLVTFGTISTIFLNKSVFSNKQDSKEESKDNAKDNQSGSTLISKKLKAKKLKANVENNDSQISSVENQQKSPSQTKSDETGLRPNRHTIFEESRSNPNSNTSNLNNNIRHSDSAYKNNSSL